MTAPNPSPPLSTVAPGFVEIAHSIVWCTVATVDTGGAPRTRILHPIWEWDGESLTGWIATSTQSLKAKHFDHQPAISLTYWDPSHDTCSAEGTVRWVEGAEARAEVWNRFLHGPEPVGYDPSMIPDWTDSTSEAFGAVQITPSRLRVMPGSVLLSGEGEVLTWTA